LDEREDGRGEDKGELEGRGGMNGKGGEGVGGKGGKGMSLKGRVRGRTGFRKAKGKAKVGGVE